MCIISQLKGSQTDFSKVIIVCLVPMLLIAAIFDFFIGRAAVGIGLAAMSLTLTLTLRSEHPSSSWLPQRLTCLYAFLTGGFFFIEGGAGNMAFLWLVMLPIIFFSMSGLRWGWILSILFFSFTMVLYAALPLPSRFSSVQISMFALAYTIQVMIAVGITSYRLKREQNFQHNIETKQQKLLDHQHHIKCHEKRIGEQAFHVKALNQIDDIIASPEQIQQQIPHVLKTICHIFNADAAWLITPCDLNSKTCDVAYEATKANQVNMFSRQTNIPMDSDMTAMFKNALATTEPVIYPHITNLAFTKKDSVRSQMVIAVHGKEGSPWLLGIHQCTFAQNWDHYQQLLFRSIAYRTSSILDNITLKQAVMDKDDQYKQLLEYMPDGFCIIAAQQLVYSNQALLKMLGIRHAKLLAKKGLLKNTLPEYHPILSQHLTNTLASTVQPSHEIKLQHRNGQHIDVIISSHPISFYGKNAVQITLKNITQQNKLDTALQNFLLKNKGLTNKLIQQGEKKRAAIAQDLHDDSGQLLTALSANLVSLKTLKSADQRQQRIEDTEKIVQSLFSSIRSTLVTLQPTHIDSLGIEYAIRNEVTLWAQRYNIKVAIDIPNTIRQPASEVSTAIFRIIQESLTNIVKHAHAQHVWITLRETTHQPVSLALTIQDDGCGFDTQLEEYKGFGLFGMISRVDLASGTFNINSHIGTGTTIHASFPGADSG